MKLMWLEMISSFTMVGHGFLATFAVIMLMPQIIRSTSESETRMLLLKTISGLNSALEFFYKEHMNVNLDAVSGTRMVEGQLNVLLHRSDITRLADDEIIEKIEKLRNLAGEVSNRATPYVAVITPKYYNRIGHLMGKGFWELDYPSQDVDTSDVIWPFQEGESMHEDDSDDCLTEFFGTGDHSKKRCRITNKCWRLMTSPGYNRYSLSHQVFYLEIGTQFGCSREMRLEQLVSKQPSTSGLERMFCANMLVEAHKIAENGIKQDKQDLFMEQAALCGMLGFRQFFVSDWLEAILSWQNTDLGCYTGIPVHESDVDYRNVLKRTTPIQAKLRIKREERPLSGGCLCHRTTVAAAALAQYIRYILEYTGNSTK